MLTCQNKWQERCDWKEIFYHFKGPGFLLKLLIPWHFFRDFLEVLLHLVAQAHIQTPKVCEPSDSQVEMKNMVLIT